MWCNYFPPLYYLSLYNNFKFVEKRGIEIMKTAIEDSNTVYNKV